MEFDYGEFRERYLNLCKQYGVDPEQGSNGYQVIHFRARLRRRLHYLRLAKNTLEHVWRHSPSHIYIDPTEPKNEQVKHYRNWATDGGSFNWNLIRNRISRNWWMDVELWREKIYPSTVTRTVEGRALNAIHRDCSRLDGVDITDLSSAIIDEWMTGRNEVAPRKPRRRGRPRKGENRIEKRLEEIGLMALEENACGMD